jgi:hypothetical protein
MQITPEELDRIQIALDYMENAITDVVGWANDPHTKLRWMHECKRIHELATKEIEKIRKRNQKDKR